MPGLQDHADGVTLRALLELLGPTPLTPLNGETHLDRPVDSVLLLDPYDRLAPNRRSLVLAVAARGEQVADVFARAAGADCAGVVVKTYGDSDGLREVARDVPVAVFCTDDEFQWQQLLDLVASALQSAKGDQAAGDLFALANAIAVSVGGAVSIEDSRQRVLAYSNVDGQSIDDARKQGILDRQVPDLPRHADVYRQLALAPGAFRVPANADRLGRLAVAIRAGGEMLGSIWVVDDGGLHRDADSLLDAAATTTAFHLLRARAGSDARRVTEGETLRALLDGRLSPDIAAHRLNCPARGGYSVAAIDLAVQSEMPEEVLAERVGDMLVFQMQARRRRCVATAVGRTVYALVSAGPTADQSIVADVVGDVIGRVRTTLHADAVAGLGPVVDGLAAIPASRADAERALLGVRARADRHIATLDEVREHVVLLELQRRLTEDPSLQLPSVLEMIDSDREHRTAYAVTVLAYLDTFGDVNWAASRMCVHQNTFRYRLRRAREMFGLDLDRPDVRLAVWLQLRAFESSLESKSADAPGTEEGRLTE